MAATQERAQTQKKALKMGIIGIGVGGAEILPAFESMEEVDLVAGCDVVPQTLERFQARYPETNVYDSVDKMLGDPEVEAVWISSPNRFHAPHTIQAAKAGRHVIVEKPMAINIEQAEEMINECDKNNVKLMAGHTRSFTLPMRAARHIIKSGRVGRVQAMNTWSYTDWLLRPRTADELDLAQGGGIPYRQGPHQIDTIRLIGGGNIRSVRAQVGQWWDKRSIPGYYAAYLEFEDGTPATIVHNGYGYFLGAELAPWGESRQRYDVEERVRIRKEMNAGTRKEAEEKQDLRIGGEAENRIFRTRPAEPRGWVPEDAGLCIISCERGDVRQSRFGVYVYDDNGVEDVKLDPSKSGAGGRRAELVEFYDHIVGGQPMFHDGRWGIGTLEVIMAIMESARERKEVYLTRQKEVPDWYDSDLEY